MQFRTLALSTMLTIATLTSAPAAIRANTLAETSAQPSELQAKQSQAALLQPTTITLNQTQSSFEARHRLQDATTNIEAYTSLLKEFTLTVRKGTEQQPQNAPVNANTYSFGSSPSFDGESASGQSLGYRHLDFSSNSN